MRDLCGFRKPAGDLFVEDLGAIERDLESAALGRDEGEILDLVRVLFQQRRRQTGGAGKVISGHAVDNSNFHGCHLPSLGCFCSRATGFRRVNDLHQSGLCQLAAGEIAGAVAPGLNLLQLDPEELR